MLSKNSQEKNKLTIMKSEEMNYMTGKNNIPTRSTENRFIENILLVWLDGQIDESNKNFQYSLKKLREIVHIVNTYTNIDKCTSFIKRIKDEKVFMIISGSLGQQIISNIHDIQQIDSIYVFCGNVSKHQQWTKQWSKIKGVHDDIRLICEAIKKEARQCERDSTSIQIVDTRDLSQLEPTFMYTLLLKETILEYKYDQQSMDKLINECRKMYAGNEIELKIIQEFKDQYQKHTPIWWYTRECFTYHVLNRALRTFEVDIIVFMGIFIRDLHRRIEQLHPKQKQTASKQLILFRGQGLSKAQFDILQKSPNGLLSFNNFLSTSENKEISYDFACRALNKADHVAILFKMNINPSIANAPYAVIDKMEGYFGDGEKEILFSMNTVFRIGKVEPLNKKNLFQVELTLTTPETDDVLQKLTKQIRKDIEGPTAWHRMAHLLRLSGYPKQAQELYEFLLKRTSETNYEEFSQLNQMLGIVHGQQDKFDDGIKFLEKAIEIREKFLPKKYIDLIVSYTALGELYSVKREHVKALQCYGKAEEIQKKFCPEDDVQLALLYTNIGCTHGHMGEFSKALEYFTEVLNIRLKNYTENHPTVAASYSNLGNVYMNMGQHQKGSEYLHKSHDIFKKSLPPYHLDLCQSYHSLGILYLNMGEFSKALEHFQAANEIAEKALPANDIRLTDRYQFIGNIYLNTGNATKALEYFQKSLKIREKSLSPNDPDLALNYNNVGHAYMIMGEFTKALDYLHKALKILENSKVPKYLEIAIICQNLTDAYERLAQPLKVIEFGEKFIEMSEKALTPNHPSLLPSYNNMMMLYTNMKEYAKALQYQQKINDVLKKISTPSDNNSLALNYRNMAFLCMQTHKYAKALIYTEKSLEIQEKLVPQNKNDLIMTYKSSIDLSHMMGEYSKAFEWMKKLQEILKNSFPSTHPEFGIFHKNMSELYYDIKQYSKAREHLQKLLDLTQKLFPSNYSELFLWNSRICELDFEMQDTIKGQTTFQQCIRIQQIAPAITMQTETLYWLGKLHCVRNDYGRSLGYFTRAVELLDTTRPDKDIILALTYSNLGNVQQLIGNYQHALLVLQQGIQIFEKTLSPRNELAVIYSYMGETYRKMGKYSEALDFFDKAKKIREKLTPTKHPDLAASYHDFAQVYKNTKQHKLAYENAQKAFEIARHTLPETHPLCVKYKQTLMTIQQKN